MEKKKIFLTVVCLFTLVFTFNAKEVFANNRRAAHGINRLENHLNVKRRKKAENEETVNMQNRLMNRNNDRNNNRDFNKRHNNFVNNYNHQ